MKSSLRESSPKQRSLTLDFDGGVRLYRNAELGMEIPVGVSPSGISDARRKHLAAALRRAGFDVAATGTRTIHVGRTDAFDAFGRFAGLAEGIGTGDAFVFLDDSASDAELLEVIGHEAEHILGKLDHGGAGLARYAYTYTHNDYHIFFLDSGEGAYLSRKLTGNVTFKVLTPQSGMDELYLDYNESATFIYNTYHSYSYKDGHGSTEYRTDYDTAEGYINASGITAGTITITGGSATGCTANSMSVRGKVIYDSIVYNYHLDQFAHENIYSGFAHHQGSAVQCTVNGQLSVGGNAVARSCTVNGSLLVGGRDYRSYSNYGAGYFSGTRPLAENCTVNGNLLVGFGGDAKNCTVNGDVTVGDANNFYYGYSSESIAEYISTDGYGVATNLVVNGTVFVGNGGELNNARINGPLHFEEGGKLSGGITCKSVQMYAAPQVNVTIKLDLREYADANYTEKIYDNDGYLVRQIDYFANYTTRIYDYTYTYNPNTEAYSYSGRTISYGTFDNNDYRFNMSNWSYTFSAHIGGLWTKAAYANVVLDLGGMEKEFDSGRIYMYLPEGICNDDVIYLVQPAVGVYDTLPMQYTGDKKKWQLDENYHDWRSLGGWTSADYTDTCFVYNPTLHGEAADVLWLENGWGEDTEYTVELPTDVMGGSLEVISITDKETGNGAHIGNATIKNSELVIKGGADTGNITIKAEDKSKQDHECDLELIVVPEEIPVVGKLGAKKYSEMLKKAQKEHLTKITDIIPYDIDTTLFGAKFTLSGMGATLTVNWSKPSMELKLQGKMEWEIGKEDNKKLTLDLSGDNYISVTRENGAFGWDFVGELSVPDFHIGKFGFSNMSLSVNKGESTFSVSGYIKLPSLNYKFGGSISIVNGYMDSMSIGVDDLNVPLGATGLMLQSISGSVEGIATSLDMTFGGNMGFTYGPKINIEWDCDWLGIDDGEYSLLEINVGATISTSGEITGSAGISSLGGFITGSGTVLATEGFFSIDGTFSLLNGCISIAGELNSGSSGVVISGTGTMSVPRNKYFGPLAGMGLSVNCRADFGARYVVAWEDMVIFGNKFSVGIKCSFDGDVDLLGASDLLGGDKIGTRGLRSLKSSASGDSNLRGATPPSASQKYIVSDYGMSLFQVNFSVPASTASVSISYNGVEYTQEAISSGLYANMQIVNELTGKDCITIAVNNADLGEWTVNAYGDDQATFGAYTFAGTVAKPTVNAVELGGDQRSATIRYTLSDLSGVENATVSVFRAAGDAAGQTGALLAEFSAAEATGVFNYAPADDLPGGSYAFYLLVSGDNYAPVYSDLSAAVDFITIDNIAPDQIQKVGSEWHSTGSTLTWSAPYDNTGVAGYKISYRASEEDEWIETDAAATSFTFTTVPNGTYAYRVAAYDEAGNIATWSVEDSVLVNLGSNAAYKNTALAEDTALAEYEGAVNVDATAVKLTAAQNSLVSASTLGDAEIFGIVEESVIVGETELLTGARGFGLAVNGVLAVGLSVGEQVEVDPFAEESTEKEYVAPAVASGVTVNEGGKLTVGSFGQVNGATVAAGGAVQLVGDAEITDLVMDYGTTMTVAGDGKYSLAGDIRTAGTLNTKRKITGGGHKIIFEQYKQTAEYETYEFGADNTWDKVAFTDDMDKLGSRVLEIVIDSNVYGSFKIADKAQYFDGTVTVTDHADGSSAVVGLDSFMLVGNALCRLEKRSDVLYLSTTRSAIGAPTVTVERAESNAYDTIYVRATAAEGTGRGKAVTFRYSLNADMSDAVVVDATYLDYDGNGNGSLSLSKYDLVDNATYYVQAFVENEHGVKSLWSDAVNFTVVPKLLPDAPASLTVTDATNPDCTHITFTAGKVDDPEYTVRDYRFRYADNPEFENAITITTGQRLINYASISKAGIVDGKDYYVQAGVQKGADWSYWTDTVVFNTQGWDYDGITVEADGPYAYLTLGKRRARNITVAEGGYFYGGSGVVDGITVDGGFFRDDGATVTDAVVNSGSYWLYGGSVSDIQVNAGEFRLYNGSLDGAFVGASATAEIVGNYTPTVSGTIFIQGQLKVAYYNPGVSTDASFVFDLGAHEAETMRDKMFIDYTGPLLGSRTFTVKLDDTPEVGDYTLTYVPKSGEFYAGLAAADGSNLGVMALGGDAIKYNEFYYSLVAMSSRVYLHVSADDGPALLGKVKLSKNGTAYDSNDYYNYLTVSAASECDHALVEAEGELEMVTIGNGGKVEVYGELWGATVEDGGILTLNEGGLLRYNPITINKGGQLIVNGGAIQREATITVAGTLTVNGALQSYENDGDSYYATYHGFTFALDQFDAPNTDVLITDYELLKTCNASFSVSVSADQAEGEYQLMGNAASYAYGVTLYVEGGASYGEYIWFGGNGTEINGRNYALAVRDNILTLTVGGGSPVPPDIIPDVVARTQMWDLPSDTYSYVVEYSTDDFEHVVRVVVNDTALDSFAAPAGCRWRVRAEGSDEWSEIASVGDAPSDDGPRFIKSNSDGVDDVFFARAGKVWEGGYQAQHLGSVESEWKGTGERVNLAGRNRLGDLFEGSYDANVLLLTDDANGDALFVDDIYTALPGSIEEQQARIAQINEIRAGAGNDVVDMTSQRFEYVGEGLTIRGGDGDDTIWAVGYGNYLFGDAGNDRLVGGAGLDFIAGGAGNDSMHGGGGRDVFTFGGNWGVDTVEQLADDESMVMLWFAEGDHANWNAATMTYTDGSNSVTVKGVTADQVEIYIGDEFPWDFEMMSELGIFADSTSQNVFEDKNKGFLASL